MLRIRICYQSKNICHHLWEDIAMILKEAGWLNLQIACHLCGSDSTIPLCWQEWLTMVELRVAKQWLTWWQRRQNIRLQRSSERLSYPLLVIKNDSTCNLDTSYRKDRLQFTQRLQWCWTSFDVKSHQTE